MLLNALFPLQCVNCPTYGTLCCPNCLKLLQEESEQHLPYEYTPLEGFNQLVTIGSYANPVLQHLIVGLKFHGLKGCAEPLGEQLAKKLRIALKNYSQTIIVPLPLSRRRRFERGYNQTELIADAIRQHWPHAPLIHTELLKRSHRAPQTTLNDKERRNNMRNTYKALYNNIRRWAHSHPDNKGLTIILVDDVFTTGASMNDARRALSKATRQLELNVSFVICVAAVG